MLTKIISGNPINTGSAVEYVTQFGVIHSTDAKYQRGLKQYGQYDFNESSLVSVPMSGGVGTRVAVAAIPNKQITVENFSLSLSATSSVSIFSSGTGASPNSMTLLSGPYSSVAGSNIYGGPVRSLVGQNVVVTNAAGVIGGSLVYKIE